MGVCALGHESMTVFSTKINKAWQSSTLMQVAYVGAPKNLAYLALVGTFCHRGTKQVFMFKRNSP